MAKKLIAQAAPDGDADDTPICPDCGEPMHPMSEDEELDARMEMILDALDGASGHDIVMLLAFAAGNDIGAYTSKRSRGAVREEFINMMDEAIKGTAARWARINREDRAIRRSGIQTALMPDVSDRMQ